MLAGRLDKRMFDAYNSGYRGCLLEMKYRSILNFRLDSLFAMVETLRNPELVGKPVVVCKRAGNSSGIVVSASSEARSLGVQEGITVRHALRLCPDGVFVSANFDLYRDYAHRAFDILARYSPLVEPQSLEKVFVDVTGSRKLFGGAKKIAVECVREIKDKVGITASVGIAANRFTAETAAFTAGSGRMVLVAPGDEKEFLDPLPVRLMWGVGEKTERSLSDLRVRTIGQLSMIPERLLVRKFGPVGSSFHNLSLGVDYSPVMQAYPFEIINTEQMFDNEMEEPDEVREHLSLLADRLALELRKRGKLAEHVTMKLFLIDEDTIGQDDEPECRPEPRTAQPAGLPYEITGYRLKRPVNGPGEILNISNRLLNFSMRPGMKVAGIGITLSDLVIGEGIQLSLLGEGERRKRLDSALETIKDRFGEKSICYAAALSARTCNFPSLRRRGQGRFSLKLVN